MNEWKTVKLGDVCEIQSGGTPSRSKIEYWKDGNIPWVKIGDFSDKYISKTSELITQLGLENSSAKLFTKGTLLYSIFATLGEVSILNIDATTNQAIAGLKIKNNNQLDINYLFSYLKSIKDEVNRIGRGVAQNNINLGILKQFAIPLPPLETQQKIAAVLDKVQKIISESKVILEKYDTLIKSRFIEMFGDPVQNPMGWEVKNLDKVFDIIDGDRGKNYPKAEDFYNRGFCLFLNAGNVTKNGFNFENCQFITEEKDNSLGKGKVKRDDLIVTTRGTVGNIAKYDNSIPYQIVRINSGMVILRKTKNINSVFFIYYFRNPAIYKKLISGTAQPQMPINNMRLCKVLFPPLTLQTQFADFVQQIDKSKFAVQKSLEKAETLYKSLMQEYFA